MPRLRSFLEAYPEIDITLQVSIPLLDVVAEDADLTVRFGTGRYADVEHICLMKDEITPLASPAYIRENGPFDNPEDLKSAALLRSPLEPWRTWFAAHGLDWPEPVDGSSFNDIGLMCDAAAQGLGIGLIRLKLGAPWIENGSLERIWPHAIPSPACPLPVLAHRRAGPLGVRRVCRVAEEKRGLSHTGLPLPSWRLSTKPAKNLTPRAADWRRVVA
jgi:LysR family glycine cleavage system transcriptional activator